MGIQTSLDALSQAPRIVEAIRLADELAFEASREPGLRTLRVLGTALKGGDDVAAIAAIHALGPIVDDEIDRILTDHLADDRGFLREHAAWVLGSRIPHFEATGLLLRMVIDGGFGGMIAQRSLETWANTAPEHIAVGLEGALLGVDDPDARYRLVETLGLIRGSGPGRVLLAVARDVGERPLVRTAAVAALGQRRGDDEAGRLLDELARDDDPAIADVACLALIDLAAGPVRTRSASGGLTVAQLFLHADVDAGLSAAGSGDNGGVATLLVRLGDALIDTNRVQRVVTLSRGSAAEAVDSVADIAAHSSGHRYGRVPLLTPTVSSANAWPQRVAARRGIRRVLRAAGDVDLLHLRMAEVGSLAASDVARELDIPVVFTVAPDPHAVIQSMDSAGSLTRSTFGAADEREHFWFRSRLVQRLASNANHTVLFPRPELRRDMRALVGIDIDAHAERHTVVPEGIDLRVVDRAVRESGEHAEGAAPSPALAELRRLIETLPAGRRHLPLLVSVGRFHRVKGMAAIVQAWQGSDAADQANLLLIGGNLRDPSADESQQIDAIGAILPAARQLEAGLLMPGHQPNDTVARWVAAARMGLPGLSAANGVYVCGSLKEEFGIALLEAMATGLLVVAPDGGGPATYVEHGVTGFLTRTWDDAALTAAIQFALAAAAAETSPDRAIRSRAVVEQSFTIQAMAAALGGVYERVRQESVEAEWPVTVS
jgi:glycosyltransferase involved in cell wall biosynthesis